MRLKTGEIYAVYCQDHSENCDDTVPARAVGWLIDRTRHTLKRHAWIFDDDATDLSQNARFAIDRRTVTKIVRLANGETWERKPRHK